MDFRATAWLLASASLFFSVQCSGPDTQQHLQKLETWEYSRGIHLPDPTGIHGLTTSPSEGPTEWKSLEIPSLLSGNEAGKDYKGWITLRHKLPSDLNDKLNNREILAINAGRLLDVSVLCLNSNCFAQLGQQEPYRAGAMRPMLRGIPLTSLEEQNTIYIALFSNGKYPFQFMDPVEVGPVNEVFGAHRQREILAFIFLTIYVAWGLYHLMLFAGRTGDRYNLYFGLGAVLLSLYWFTANTFSREALFADHVEVHRRVEHILLFLIPPFFVAFLSEFTRQKTSAIAKVYGIYCLLTSMLVAFVPLEIMRILRDAWYLMLGLAFVYMIYRIVREVMNRNREAYFLGFGMLIVIVSLTHDILQSKDIVHTPKIASFTFVALVSGLAALMASRFMRVTNEVEELNRDLDQKVRDRTSELQETMESLQVLKEQQDGDYYLTSLILGPIGGDLARSRHDVSILIEQKKKFEFRHKSSEIGGDICVADRLMLRGLHYRVLLNGDAMGKSVQGAGGAMVLGTVFRSALARTRLFEDTHELTPEHWIRQVYLELETVFRPFDGSMMASFILALVEENTGFTYLLNVEHPWAVLLREGEARFIETECNLRKIGVTAEHLESDFRIDTVRLHPGDRLILGSDGRDDVWLNDQDRTLNADETALLYHCEKAEGNLERIRKEIKRIGELSDDLSLLAYEYKEEMVPPAADRLYDLLKQLESRQDAGIMEQALENADLLQKVGGEGEESLYRIAATYHRASNSDPLFAQLALKQSERLYYRNPGHSRNLMLLAHLYEKAGKLEEARATLVTLENLRPGDRRVQSLAEKLG